MDPRRADGPIQAGSDQSCHDEPQGEGHGVHRTHRMPGSIGACSFPGRVFKGQRMAGQMGNQQVTTLNLEVVGSDAERNMLLIKGSVPGPNGGLVSVRSAVKAAAADIRAGRITISDIYEGAEFAPKDARCEV